MNWSINKTIKTNDELKGELIYQIFIPSFADANADGIGDLNGISAKLDYLVDLGVTAIWLSPIHPSPSYHKYDVTDYFAIHQDYGSMSDFRQLISEAHKRSIKIIIDLVLNHCSSQHPWFQSALEGDPHYRPYFIWSTLAEIEKSGTLKKSKSGDSDNLIQWNQVVNQDEYYFSYFWEGMPDLNYDNPAVVERAYEIGEFWLKDVGVDGFRLDAAKHIFPTDRASDTLLFWKAFKAMMVSLKSDVFLLGEVWSDIKSQSGYAESFDALFNFDLSYSMLETVKQEKVLGASVYADSWKLHERVSLVDIITEGQSAFNKVNPSFISANYLSNHDQERSFSFLGNNLAKAKLAANILMTLPGIPCIYYGEELGMRGKKPDEYIREPFLWAEVDRFNTSWIDPKYNTVKTLAPLANQVSNEQSLYHHYQKLIKLRKSSLELNHGMIETAVYEDEQILAYERKTPEDAVLIIHNLSRTKKTIEAKAEFNSIFYTSSLELSNNIGSFVLSAYSSIILSKN